MSNKIEDKAGYNPFELTFKPRWLAAALGKLLGLSKLASFYRLRPQNANPVRFLRHTLGCFNVRVQTVDVGGGLDKLPAEGPVLIVANHPLGGLEGVALAEILLEHRPDLKVLTNELLTRIPELSQIFVGVDVLSGNAQQANQKGLLQVSRHLKKGGALLIFPAGKVATYNFKEHQILDHEWNRIVGHLAKRAAPTICPIYIEGRNSRLFYLMAAVHPILRSLMLPRELSNKSGFQLTAHIGDLVGPKDIAKLEDSQAVTDYLRLVTELSRPTSNAKKQYSGVRFSPLHKLADEGAANSLTMPDDEFILLESDQFVVYCAKYDELGSMMEHIGLAREYTFREAGEGTGNATDIDQFDPHYYHLFVWDRDKQCIAGGYRVGKVDEIVAARGIDALYSRTLYRFNEGYITQLGKTLEIGRSFVQPEYQKHSKTLDLLWKGIGRFVARNPEYHTLFGAVSISNDHSDLARALIAESMLESFRAEQRYLDDIRPVEPLKVSGKVWTREMLASLSSVSLINKLIGRCDPGKALPILLRHYLSLNGRFVCFSINKVFNDSLDGLIIVDMRETPQKYLDRYIGKEGAAICQQIWNQQLMAG